jgi:hypothetical protein
MGDLVPFIRPPKLGRGERPKRSDTDRLADLDSMMKRAIIESSELAYVPQMAPCEGCETHCSGCRKITIGEAFDTSLIDFALQGAPPKESA